MPEVTTPYQPGTPCWIDLVVPDQQAALDFYATLFGWAGEIGPAETGGYAVCTLRGKPTAGIMSAQAMGDTPTPPTVWTTHISSADVNAAEQAVTRAGGTVIVPPMDVMELGRMLVVSDPTGAVFGVWQPGTFIGAGIVNEPGSFVWNELATTDLKQASAFYSEVLGIETTPMEGAENYFALTVNDRTVGGARELGPETPAGTPPHWLVYFSVDDTDASVATLEGAGGTVLQRPFDMAAGRMAVVQDPQGATFALISAQGPNPV